MGRSESESSISRKERQVNERSALSMKLKLKLSQFGAFCSILMDLFLTFDVKT